VFSKVRTTPPERVRDAEARLIVGAVELYRSDLLAGWEEEWCVRERERLKAVYLTLLEKLVGWCETSNRIEAGLAYGDMLLKHDRAHERAHWRLMRLHQLAGNRSGALRQFEKCRTALDEELGVGPGRLTRSLYEEISTSG
jgi:DNA-binding SARP family transcriptional activator